MRWEALSRFCGYCPAFSGFPNDRIAPRAIASRIYSYGLRVPDFNRFSSSPRLPAAVLTGDTMQLIKFSF
jgi:hypothetical protein